MAGVGTAYVSVRVDTSKFEGDLAKMLTRLSTKMNKAGDQLGKDMVNGLKGTDWDSGTKGLSDSFDKAAKKAVKSLDQVDTRVSLLGRNTDRVTQNMVHGVDSVSDALRDAKGEAGGLSSELTSVGRAGGRINLGGIGGGRGGGGSSMRTAGDDANFLRKSLNYLAKDAERSRAILAKLFDTAAIGGSALGLLVGAASGAAQGLFALGANAAAMVPALSVATTGIIGLAQAGVTLKLAFAGVGEAISSGIEEATPGTAAYTAAAKAAGGLGDQMKKLVKPAHVSRDAIKSAKEAVAAAARGIQDAKQGVADAAQGIKDARDDLARAYRDAAWSAEDAARTVMDAEAELAASQVRTAAAQQALNDVRAEALEQLEDIGFAAEDAALGEERAEVALEEAYAKLVAVSELSPDNKTRQAAELAFKEAELNLRQAKDAREDADAAQAQAAATGIEGTEAYTSAQSELVDAQQDQADAAQALADAQREQAQTAITDAEAVMDAERGVADARRDHQDALQGLIDAQADYQDALDGVKEAQADYRRALRDAAAAAAEANKAVKLHNAEIAAAPPVMSAFQQAMQNMSPAQKEFITRIIGMHDEFIKFRQDLAEPIFQSLNSGLTKVIDGGLLDTLKTGLLGTSDALAGVIDNNTKGIDSFGELAGSPAFSKSLGAVMDSNNESLKHFGGAAVNLADAFVQIAEAASPLLEDLSKWVETTTDGWVSTRDSAQQTEKLSDKFQTAAERVKEFWGLGVELWKTLRKLGDAANEAAVQWDGFDNTGTKGFIPNMTENLKEFRKALKHDDLVDNFNTALDTLASTGRAVNTLLIEPFIAMGHDDKFREAMDKFSEPGVSANMKKLSDSAGTAAPKIADIAVSVIDIVAAMSESHAIDHFLDILGGVADVLEAIIGFAADTGILKITGYITGMYAAWRIFKAGFKIVTSPFAALLTGALDFKKTLSSDGFKAAVKGMFGGKTTGAADEARAKQEGSDITEAFGKGIKAGMKYKDAAMKALRDNVKLELGKVASMNMDDAIKAGGNIMEGVETGLREGAIEAVTAATKAGRDVANAVGKGAGTMSPSTITMVDGANIMEGLELGIKEGTIEAELAAKAAGAKVGHAVGSSATTAATTSTAGIGPAMSTSATSSMGKSSGRMAGAFGKMMTPLKGVARGMGGLMTLAMGPFGIALDVIILLLPIIIPLLKKLEEKTGIFSKTLDGLQWALGKVWDAIKFVFNWVKDNWPLILTILTGPIGLAVSQIIKHWDDIKAAVDAAVTFVKDLLGNIWDGITAGWDKIEEFFTGLWTDHIKPWMDDIIAKATALLGGVWDGIKAGWWALVEWSDILEDWVKTKIENLVEKAKGVLKNIWKVIGEKWDALLIWAGGLWGEISGKFNSLVTSAGGVLKDIWDKIKSAWTNLGTFFSGLWGDIKAYIGPGEGSLLNKAGDALLGFWQGIKDAFEDIKTWVGNLWEKSGIQSKIGDFVDSVSGALGGIWFGMKKGFAEAWNWVAGMINTKLIAGINSVLGFFNAPKIGFTVGTMDVPTKAEGGWVTGPGGPKDDKILQRLSNKEYVLPARSAAKLGPRALEHMRRTGELPFGQGGIGDWFKGGWEKIKNVAEAVKDGAEAAIKWALSRATDALGKDNGVIPSTARGFIGTLASKVLAWAKNKDQEMAAAAAGPAGVYHGPATGWTYPLTRFYPGGTYTGHNPYTAIDIAAPGGTPVRAASGGRVALVADKGSTSYGKYIIIQHAGGWDTLYAHLSSQGVRVGQIVTPGTLIGRSGNTGGVRGANGGYHLHFELSMSPGSSGAKLTETYMAERGVRMARGGVVSPSSLGTMAILAESGQHERVTPLDREGFSPSERKIIELLESKVAAGGSGDTYNIHPSTQVNEAQLADLVSRRVSWNRRRGAGV